MFVSVCKHHLAPDVRVYIFAQKAGPVPGVARKNLTQDLRMKSPMSNQRGPASH